VGLECHQSWLFVRRHFQLYNTSPMILNWPWAWPCWNCTMSYKFSVSVKKMGEGWTGGAKDRDIVKAKSSGEDPRATGGLVSNLSYPRVNKTKQRRLLSTANPPASKRSVDVFAVHYCLQPRCIATSGALQLQVHCPDSRLQSQPEFRFADKWTNVMMR